MTIESPATPVVSILVPNFDNGRASSASGARDFLGDLFGSLQATLADDPTPLEILVIDDGSTDDSLETCRTWAQRTWRAWRGDERFCRLEERAHCGVLSVIANALTEAAKGRIICRLDGDVVVLTPRWAEKLVAIFDSAPPSVGIVGPKQLGTDGSIHSAGSFVLHPRGHHHVLQGAPREAMRRAIEVDHVMGAFYCHKREVWEKLGGYDERFLRGQTVDFGLRARRAGWRAIAVPTIEFTHAHALRKPRATTADSTGGIDGSLGRFEAKWGFSRLAPDLDAVAARWAGTELLWNARVFGPKSSWLPASRGPIDIERSEWGRYAADQAFREAINRRVEIAQDLVGSLAVGAGSEPGAAAAIAPRILQVGSRAGLMCHLLARWGASSAGVDPDPHHVEFAQQIADRERYPADPPSFDVMLDHRTLPVASGAYDVVLLYDVLDRHPNPVGLLREAHRVLRAGAVAIIVRERDLLSDGDESQGHPYRPHELMLQLRHTGLFAPAIAQGPPGTVHALATRRADRTHSHGSGAARPIESVEATANVRPAAS